MSSDPVSPSSSSSSSASTETATATAVASALTVGQRIAKRTSESKGTVLDLVELEEQARFEPTVSVTLSGGHRVEFSILDFMSFKPRSETDDELIGLFVHFLRASEFDKAILTTSMAVFYQQLNKIALNATFRNLLRCTICLSIPESYRLTRLVTICTPQLHTLDLCTDAHWNNANATSFEKLEKFIHSWRRNASIRTFRIGLLPLYSSREWERIVKALSLVAPFLTEIRLFMGANTTIYCTVVSALLNTYSGISVIGINDDAKDVRCANSYKIHSAGYELDDECRALVQTHRSLTSLRYPMNGWSLFQGNEETEDALPHNRNIRHLLTSFRAMDRPVRDAWSANDTAERVCRDWLKSNQRFFINWYRICLALMFYRVLYGHSFVNSVLRSEVFGQIAEFEGVGTPSDAQLVNVERFLGTRFAKSQYTPSASSPVTSVSSSSSSSPSSLTSAATNSTADAIAAPAPPPAATSTATATAVISHHKRRRD